MTTAGARAGARDATAATTENPAGQTAAKIAGLKRCVRAIRALCEGRSTEPLAAEVLAALAEEGW